MKLDISCLVLLFAFISLTNCNVRIARQDASSTCTTPDGEAGVCFNIRQCPVLLDLLQNQRHKPGVADLLRKSVCGYDNRDPRVCCPNKQPVQPTGRTDTTGNGGDEFPELLSAPNCGKSGVQQVRIVGGQPSELGAWPWIAVLGYRSNRNPTPQWLCGGALVSSRHVITAAHCTKHPSLTLFKVRLGELDLNNSVNDGANPVDVNIERAITHPAYNPSKFTDDIAILKLESEVRFTQLIQPICLPKQPDMRKLNFVKNFPFVAGWGSIEFKGPSLTALQEIQIPVVENEECKKAYNTKGADIISRQMCAGYARGGKDACQGDSGGPLMLPKAGAYYLIGVVSYGFRCAEAGFPGIYSRVTSYIPWIAQNMK